MAALTESVADDDDADDEDTTADFDGGLLDSVSGMYACTHIHVHVHVSVCVCMFEYMYIWVCQT